MGLLGENNNRENFLGKKEKIIKKEERRSLKRVRMRIVKGNEK